MEVISVIVPFYNGNKYLSGLKQMLENNAVYAAEMFDIKVELVLVNDSPWVQVEKESIKSACYNYVQVDLTENCGIHHARVKGLEAASGRYIAFLDQDDLWADTFVGETYACFLKEDVGCVIANGIFQTPQGDKVILNSYGRAVAAKKYFSYLVLGNLLSSPGQCMIKKDAVPPYWMENIMRTNCSDDLYLWCLLFKDQRAAYCNQLLFTHVDTGENTSSNIEKGYDSDMEMYALLKDSGLIGAFLLRIFLLRCTYNRMKMSGKKNTGYFLYGAIEFSAKVLMRAIALVYRLSGAVVPEVCNQ